MTENEKMDFTDDIGLMQMQNCQKCQYFIEIPNRLPMCDSSKCLLSGIEINAYYALSEATFNFRPVRIPHCPLKSMEAV